MAKQSFQLDPAAQSYTDNEIVAKINAATTDITRAGCVDPVARPIEAGEVSNAEMADGAAKANLDEMAETVRGYVKTDPATGQFPVLSMERQADGKLKVDYDNVPKE